MPREGRYVFPGRSSATTFSDMSLTAVLRRMGRGDITVHGFHSSFRDWCADAVGNTFAREVCEYQMASAKHRHIEKHNAEPGSYRAG